VPHGDRALAIVLGLALGLAIVAIFVFVFSEETIDSAGLDRGGAPAQEQSRP
jgi:hypothetical protein